MNLFDQIDDEFRWATYAQVKSVLKMRPHLYLGIVVPAVLIVIFAACVQVLPYIDSSFWFVCTPMLTAFIIVNGLAVFVSISNYITACESKISFSGDFKAFSEKYTEEQLAKGRLGIIYPPRTDRQGTLLFAFALALLIATVITILLLDV